MGGLLSGPCRPFPVREAARIPREAAHPNERAGDGY